MIVSASPRMGVRSANRQNLSPVNVVSMAPQAGMGFTLPDLTSGVGYVGYLAAAGVLAFLLFGTDKAKARRDALGIAKSNYRERVAEIRKKYSRF